MTLSSYQKSLRYLDIIRANDKFAACLNLITECRKINELESAVINPTIARSFSLMLGLVRVMDISISDSSTIIRFNSSIFASHGIRFSGDRSERYIISDALAKLHHIPFTNNNIIRELIIDYSQIKFIIT